MPNFLGNTTFHRFREHVERQRERFREVFATETGNPDISPILVNSRALKELAAELFMEIYEMPEGRCLDAKGNAIDAESLATDMMDAMMDRYGEYHKQRSQGY